MHETVHYLLLQVRNPGDPMRGQEVNCFARALGCPHANIRVIDLLNECPPSIPLADVDIVLLGGSGDYSVAQGGPWMPRALDAMRELHDLGKPTFASCWGFQAMAKAMGGEVVTDLARAELGTHTVRLTAAGRQDPLFRSLGTTFLAQMGHQDIVDRLPEGAELLASTALVKHQAFRFTGKPIYCTQFHPELGLQCFMERVDAYSSYVEKIAGVSLERFKQTVLPTPAMDSLLLRFVDVALQDEAGA